MARLNSIDRKLLEDLLGMRSGYVLDFTDPSYAAFFREADIDINRPRFAVNGTSKAKRMRSFWDTASDGDVGKVIKLLFEYIQATNPNGCGGQVDSRHQEVLAKLMGPPPETSKLHSEQEFLATSFGTADLSTLGLDATIAAVIEQRLREIDICLRSEASLALIFLTGSTLEALLLNAACQKTQMFNQAKAAPRDSQGVKKFPRWSLSDLINVAHEVGIIGLDVKTYSHALRDFRNFIHPYEQARADFKPDVHTARISLQVLKAAVAELCGQR